MHKQTRYQIQRSVPEFLDSVGVSTQAMLQKCGLPVDLFQSEGRALTAKQVFDLWEAMLAQAPEPRMVLEMARKMARGPVIPAVFAFSCSPNIATGLERLAIFKPLVAPVRLLVSESATRVTLEIDIADPSLKMPDGMAAFELVYFLELARTFTGVDILPIEIGTPAYVQDQELFDRFFGRKAVLSRKPKLVFSREDAYRPLLSESPKLWAGYEKELTRQLAEQRRITPMSARVRHALLELLPAGRSTVDAVCEKLVTSRRSLQRHLKAEGMTFQQVLDTTRSDLSLHYLRDKAMSVEEISYLLAYRDPNSFYRAFHTWTGATPAQKRHEMA
ncbi:MULTISPECIES: AraC family transcriptional regulator [unclassified Shimia]|uniref:AraC family transcriptional regulator n=1 Tax=unclassified Shimia TaxID=2630038 RepID=UPI001ADAA13A|nr:MULTISPECIES: AraC family transcriptional regulator [unclassified Shimia]MBO9474513.1 AraC family transcriptional regulator ligand-binding domain-containing protein [Shimia sp. R10_1]MDA5557221.1 AraC family transcriptional regulator ligand-binding domain-containing protein [Shimia sp. MMG029]